MRCPCGSNEAFDLCCGPYVRGEKSAPTAEALMRSRYTAYTLGNIDHIARTLAPESRGDFDARAARRWASEADWLGLRIVSTERGDVGDAGGIVEFVATYRQAGETIEHGEVSQFRKTDAGEWFFVSGDTRASVAAGGSRREPPSTFARETPKVGRNDPCPCGSGRKFKKCCGA